MKKPASEIATIAGVGVAGCCRSTLAKSAAKSCRSFDVSGRYRNKGVIAGKKSVSSAEFKPSGPILE